MKKISAVLIICFVIFSFSYASPSDSRFDEIYGDVLSKYNQDTMFQMHLESDPESAMEMIYNISTEILQNEKKGSVERDSYGYTYYVDGVPLDKQSENYNCGYYNVAMALYGTGHASQVIGSNLHEKADEVEEYVGHVGTPIIVWEASDALNHYSNRTYAYYVGDNMTISNFEDKTANSLFNDSPALLHAKTKYFGYYNGYNYGHYLLVDVIDTYNDRVRVRDCHYDQRFFGTHTVDLEEAYNSINKKSGRYLICD